MRVKICGITNLEDALHAAESGADALGFIFVDSSARKISPDTARRIIRELPPFVVPVGVFADASNRTIVETAEWTGIRCVQLHGNETPESCRDLPILSYKAFHVGDGFDAGALTRYPGTAFLLDTAVDGMRGGTGITFDWNIARAASAHGRIILAGGLTPANIAEAISTAQPYGVDVNSGVESAPGKKDPQKLRELFQNIRSITGERNN